MLPENGGGHLRIGHQKEESARREECHAPLYLLEDEDNGEECQLEPWEDEKGSLQRGNHLERSGQERTY